MSQFENEPCSFLVIVHTKLQKISIFSSEYAPLIGSYGLQFRFWSVIGWNVGEIWGADWPKLITVQDLAGPKVTFFLGQRKFVRTIPSPLY